MLFKKFFYVEKISVPLPNTKENIKVFKIKVYRNMFFKLSKWELQSSKENVIKKLTGFFLKKANVTPSSN